VLDGLLNSELEDFLPCLWPHNIPSFIGHKPCLRLQAIFSNKWEQKNDTILHHDFWGWDCSSDSIVTIHVLVKLLITCNYMRDLICATQACFILCFCSISLCLLVSQNYFSFVLVFQWQTSGQFLCSWWLHYLATRIRPTYSVSAKKRPPP